MPQGRDSLKTTFVQITRSTREKRKTKLVHETDQRQILVAYRVVIVSRRFFIESIYSGFPETLSDLSIFSSQSKGI